MTRSYKHAPITEAIIEIRTKSVIGAGDLERVVARFSRKFPSPPQKLFDFKVDVRTIAPSYGRILMGQDVVTRHYQMIDDVMAKTIADARAISASR